MESTPFRDVAGRAGESLGADAWDARWQKRDIPWDMAQPAPPFVGALARGLVKAPGRAIVPGCGAGHDARFLAEAGFQVTGVDLSEAAVDHARELACEVSAGVEFVVADLFDLTAELSGFDLFLEHTCFCAIHPDLRDDYVRVAAERVRPGGQFMGLFFLLVPEQGPPFGTTEAEVRHRFGGAFAIDVAEVARDSHPARQGRELFAVMTRKG